MSDVHGRCTRCVVGDPHAGSCSSITLSDVQIGLFDILSTRWEHDSKDGAHVRMSRRWWQTCVLGESINQGRVPGSKFGLGFTEF